MESQENKFEENYKILVDVAAKLESNDVDLDEMIREVQRATMAYQICKSKIDVIESFLDENFTKE